MTIAVSLKVMDGLVLAADSASTLMSSQGVENVYNNANKVFNLVKGLPIGLITWGLGGLNGLSISTLAKDLRARFSDSSDGWYIHPETYALTDVAARVREFFYEQHYVPAEAHYKAEGNTEPFPSLGFILAWYSAGQHHGEEYSLDLTPAGCAPPQALRPGQETGASWSGQPEALTRLVNGFGSGLPDVLVNDFGVTQADIGSAMDIISQRLGSPLVSPAMPFKDAIDLAEWLVSIAIGYSRFMPGAATVGGPIETAAISKHEGFKWVRRKHYYSSELNPESS